MRALTNYPTGIIARTSSMRYFSTRGVTAGALLAALVACNTDRLIVPNFQNPTSVSALSDPAAVLPLLAAGVLRDDRGSLTGFISGLGMLGRESYNYSPTESRSFTNWMTAAVNDVSAGGGALWSGYYTTRRDVYGMRQVVSGSASGVFTDAQKNSAYGFADTFDALSMLYIIDTRNQVGAPVGMSEDPKVLQPFVSRDSVYGYIVGQLSTALTELGGGGNEFPFALTSGFTGFDTPATFSQFTAGLLARALAYRASLGVDGCTVRSATCYQQVLTALGKSFINVGGDLSTGVYQTYSQAAGDVTNGLNLSNHPLAHAHVDQGVETKPDGTPDNRFLTKVQPITPPVAPSNPAMGLRTGWQYAVYPTLSSPVPIIRNEELILLRAEAEYFTGATAAALADINVIRTQSGGLAPRGAFTSDDDFITELLYNRRESLAFEGGHRWIDTRRFGRLDTLPIDSDDPAAVPNAIPQIIVDHLPVPLAECLIRKGASGDLAVPAPGNCSSS